LLGEQHEKTVYTHARHTAAGKPSRIGKGCGRAVQLAYPDRGRGWPAAIRDRKTGSL